MQTREFVSYMSKRMGGLSLTPTELLVSLNALQNEILGEDCSLMRVSPDPFITTVSGTYTYTASDAIHRSAGGTSGALVGDVRRVSNIYTHDQRVGGAFGLQTGAFGTSSARPNRIEQMPNTTRVNAVFDCTDSKEPEAEDCVIHFFEDNNPGSSTTVWRGEVYLWPTQILTVNDAITIPAQYHTTLLKFGLQRDIEQTEHGREGDPRPLYEKYLAEFYGWCAQRVQSSVPDCTPPREC